MAPIQAAPAAPFTPPVYDPATHGPARHSVAITPDGAVHVTHHGPAAVPAEGPAATLKAAAPAKGTKAGKASAAFSQPKKR